MNAKIVSFQMNCRMGEVRANLETIRDLAKSVEKSHPDFVCFPELATTGYALNEKWRKHAEEIPGETTDELSSIAKELGAYLICGVDELTLRPRAFTTLPSSCRPMGGFWAFTGRCTYGIRRENTSVVARDSRCLRPSSEKSGWPFVMTSNFRRRQEPLRHKEPRFCFFPPRK